MGRILTRKQVIARLERWRGNRSYRKAAAEIGLSHDALFNALRGHKSNGEKVYPGAKLQAVAGVELIDDEPRYRSLR